MSTHLLFAILGAVIVAQLAGSVPASRWLARRGVSIERAGVMTGALLLAGAATYALFRFGGLSLDRHPAVLWVCVCTSAFAAGIWMGAQARDVPAMELALGCLVPLEIAAALTAVAARGEGLTAAPVRALFVAPAALALCAYFGASLGYLLFASGRAELRLGYEAIIGGRLLLSKASPVLSTVTSLSVLGVALGVWLVILALSILGGFEHELQTKIIGANAHAVIERDTAEPFALDPKMVETLEAADDVRGATPFVQGDVAVASSTNYTGAAILTGIDPHRSPRVLEVLNKITKGSLRPLTAPPLPRLPEDEGGEFAAPASVPGIVIGIEMAKALSVDVGNKVRVLSPLLEVLTPVGVAPKSVSFEVVAIFDTKMYEYDARYTFVSLKEARRFLELPDDAVSGFQILTEDAEHSDEISEAAAATLGDGFHALDWKERNQALLSALKLERVVAFVVLAFIILVASFSIVNTLAMSVIEKHKEIAILKTMGARDSGVMKIFLTQGMVIGVFGTLLGVVSAAIWVWILMTFKFWLPADAYYIDALPVHMTAGDVVLVVLAALLILWNFAVFPALRGAKLTPVEGLRGA